MGDRPTIADVAGAAGVSPSTASLVFSGKGNVAEATRRRVLDSAAELGYAGPDPRAASLRRGRSGIVGVVFEEHLGSAFLDPVKTTMMDGLAEAVAGLGAGLLLLRDDPPPVVSPLASAPVDAVVLIGCSGRLRESLEVLRARRIPVVVIEGDAGDSVPRIELDNREAQRQVASHLRTLGHRDVVIVTLPYDADRGRGWRSSDESPTIDVTRDRLEGALDVYPHARIFSAGASLIAEGVEAGRAILDETAHSRPTAVIAQSDLLAAGVIRAAEERGLRVPDDLSVTGFDGIEIDGLEAHRLTTAEQPGRTKGRAAGEAIVRMLAGESSPSVRFSCTFREGSTTAPPAAGSDATGESRAADPVI